MTKKDKGFLGKLRDSLPVGRTEARRRAHQELILSARIQVTKGVMLALTHALTQRQEPLEQPELFWWKSQTAKWETIWQMFNESTKDLEDFRQISNLCKVSDAAYQLYEQMMISAAVSLLEVPSQTLREEAARWRETGMLIASLHRHCVLGKLEEATLESSKNLDESGITVMKAG